MTEDFYLGAYWGPRKESSRACAQRALRFLNSLAECDPIFSSWYETGRSRKEALSREVVVSENFLEQLFAKGVNRRDSDKSVMEDLGYDVYLWTELQEDETVTLSLSCGGWSKWVPNSCVLRFPKEGERRERLLHTGILTDIVRLVADGWEPDWAAVNSSEFRDKANLPAGAIQVGWILYLSSKLRRVPPIPPPSKAIPVKGKGTLIITTEERFSSENPQHVEQAMNVIAALRRAKLIRGRPQTKPDRTRVRHLRQPDQRNP